MIPFDSATRYILCEMSIQSDGTILGERVGTFLNARLAFNTVLELNRATKRKVFYQIELQPGVDTTLDF